MHGEEEVTVDRGDNASNITMHGQEEVRVDHGDNATSITMHGEEEVPVDRVDNISDIAMHGERDTSDRASCYVYIRPPATAKPKRITNIPTPNPEPNIPNRKRQPPEAQKTASNKTTTKAKPAKPHARSKHNVPNKDEHQVLAIAGDYDTGGSSNKLVVFAGNGSLPVGDLDEGNVSCPALQRRYNTTYHEKENLPLLEACCEVATAETFVSLITKVNSLCIPARSSIQYPF